LHALIERRGRRLWLVDQQSSSGTRVNGKAVREQVLRHDDLIQIGETRLRFGERHQE
jgi:pSer/pThr/pTyr-binding forkhead associated (FHA) protein